MVILLIGQLSAHIFMLPSFLGTKRAGLAEGLIDSLTNPLESTPLLAFRFECILRIHYV